MFVPRGSAKGNVMSTLPNKFNQVKLSTRGRGVKKDQKSVNVVCEWARAKVDT